jgi:hypothetical protein
MKRTIRVHPRYGDHQVEGSPRRTLVFPQSEEPRGTSLEEAHRRIWSRQGFFASLGPEKLARLLACDHPEVIGPPTDDAR